MRHRESYTTCIPRESTLAQWFAPYAIEEMAYGVWCIAKLGSKAARTVALASFSKSVLKASFQDGETRYARKPRDVARGETLKLLAANIALNQKRFGNWGRFYVFVSQYSKQLICVTKGPPVRMGRIHGMLIAPTLSSLHRLIQMRPITTFITVSGCSGSVLIREHWVDRKSVHICAISVKKWL